MAVDWGKKFRYLISVLIFDWNWRWLDWLIVQLCDIEVYLKLVKDEELFELVKAAHLDKAFPIDGVKPLAEKIIPEKTFYCEGCPFGVTSEIATFFYGEQSNGYCYYLNKGDFSLQNATQILWDGCKECNINEDVDWDDEENTEYNDILENNGYYHLSDRTD